MSLINQALAPYNYYNLPFIPQAFTNAMGGYEPTYLGDWHLSSEGWASDTQYYKYYENDRTGDWRIDYWDHKPVENETPQRSEYGGPSYDSIQQEAYAAQQQAQSQANQTPPDEAPAAKSADQNYAEEQGSGGEYSSSIPEEAAPPGEHTAAAASSGENRSEERLESAGAPKRRRPNKHNGASPRNTPAPPVVPPSLERNSSAPQTPPPAPVAQPIDEGLAIVTDPGNNEFVGVLNKDRDNVLRNVQGKMYVVARHLVVHEISQRDHSLVGWDAWFKSNGTIAVAADYKDGTGRTLSLPVQVILPYMMISTQRWSIDRLARESKNLSVEELDAYKELYGEFFLEFCKSTLGEEVGTQFYYMDFQGALKLYRMVQAGWTIEFQDRRETISNAKSLGEQRHWGSVPFDVIPDDPGGPVIRINTMTLKQLPNLKWTLVPKTAQEMAVSLSSALQQPNAVPEYRAGPNDNPFRDGVTDFLNNPNTHAAAVVATSLIPGALAVRAAYLARCATLAARTGQMASGLYTITAGLDDIQASLNGNRAARYQALDRWTGNQQTTDMLMQGIDLATGVASGLRALSRAACFVAGTPVITPDGPRPIEELRSGDWVLSRSDHSPDAPLTRQMVERTHTHLAPVLTLRVSGQTIPTTAEHPFFVIGEGWKQAYLLQVGDQLMGFESVASSSLAVVEGVEQTEEWLEVHNLTVTEDHTYFIGGDAWGFTLWVHNTYTMHLARRDSTGKAFYDVLDSNGEVVAKDQTEKQAKALVNLYNRPPDLTPGGDFERKMQSKYRNKIVRQNEKIVDENGKPITDIDFETADALYEVKTNPKGYTTQYRTQIAIARARGKKLVVLYKADHTSFTKNDIESIKAKLGDLARYIEFRADF